MTWQLPVLVLGHVACCSGCNRQRLPSAGPLAGATGCNNDTMGTTAPTEVGVVVGEQ